MSSGGHAKKRVQRSRATRGIRLKTISDIHLRRFALRPFSQGVLFKDPQDKWEVVKGESQFRWGHFTWDHVQFYWKYYTFPISDFFNSAWSIIIVYEVNDVCDDFFFFFFLKIILSKRILLRSVIKTLLRSSIKMLSHSAILLHVYGIILFLYVTR